MAQASADIDEADLEQRILQALKNAGSPMKAVQLAKECKVPKRNINQALYRMKEKLQVHDAGSATWCLGEGGAGALVPRAPAQLSLGPVQVQEQIRRLLASQGPMRALNIAQAMGMNASRDVNPYLYDMQKDHLLNFDKKSKTWEIYQSGTPRGGSQLPTTVYHQNIVTICQSGPQNRISIGNSEAVQIGHGNSIVKHVAPAENGSAAPLPPPAAGPHAQEPAAGPWAPQDIHIDNSVLRRVQLGHGNEMTLLGAPATGPGPSPPVFTTAGPEASFKIRMPPPGPHREGQGDAAQREEEGDAAQRILIKSSFLEEAAIGSGNSLRVGPWPAGLRAGAAPGASRGHPGQPAGDAASWPGAAEPGGTSLEGAGPADLDLSAFTAHLEAMTLGNRDSEAPEDSL